ncbi:putative Protein FAM210B [Hypsibius exemplaris]|uniref:DUF1279 domain-containing protein n=1 Tax=Hypsibius exemplaris TaxID=2072580 RepID=A0A9X6NID3_HYPEX|nr:putative Protein FAM210B [Hypsibius exemplaris]
MSKATGKTLDSTAAVRLLSTTLPPWPPVEPKDVVPDAEGKPVTSRQKLKAAVRDYGFTVVIFHIFSGVTLLSMWYLIVSSGVDVSAIIETFGLEGAIGKFAGGASTFVVAYAIHKATAPLRIGLTLTATPLLVNFLRAKGIMKIKK